MTTPSVVNQQWFHCVSDNFKRNNIGRIHSLLSNTGGCFTNPKLFKGDSPLHFIARLDQSYVETSSDCLELLFKHIDIELKNNDGKTALHEAAIFSNYSLIQVLLSHGAEVDMLKMADWYAL